MLSSSDTEVRRYVLVGRRGPTLQLRPAVVAAVNADQRLHHLADRRQRLGRLIRAGMTFSPATS